MRILQRRLVRVAAAAVAVVGWGAVIVAPTGASAAIVTTPAGLSIGDQYRLAFVTSTRRDATSTDIADYNAFVTSAANSQADLLALGATWTAIASTSTVDARDNTGTRPLSAGGTVGVPIFLLDGTTKITENNAALWDGSIDFPINIFQDGVSASTIALNTVFTGTGITGLGFGGIGLGCAVGTVCARFGLNSSNDSKWITFAPALTSDTAKFYGLSSTLTVVPLPGALILFGSGLACLAVLRRRNRSVRPA